MEGKIQLSVYYTSLNWNQLEKQQSNRLLWFLDSKDFQTIGAPKIGAKSRFEIACIDVNQLMAKHNKEEGIRKHLIEYKGLKQIDGGIPLPQIVINEENLAKSKHWFCDNTTFNDSQWIIVKIFN